MENNMGDYTDFLDANVPFVLNPLIDLLKQYQQQALWHSVNGYKSDEFVLNLLATMLVEAIVWWLEEGRPYNTQEITTRCISLASAILKETGIWQ